MWKNPPDTASQFPDTVPPVSAATPMPSAESTQGRPPRVKVRIIRPDGSSREVTVAGHFREEHLCSLVDDELCRLDEGDALVLHLFHPDEELTRSLKNRWHEGMSDNRHVFVREVLGPTNNPQQVATQLRRVKERMASGERINLAIRSPRVAKAARDHLRKLLLISQQFEESLLKVWVHGDEEQQQKILGHLEGVGLIRAGLREIRPATFGPTLACSVARRGNAQAREEGQATPAKTAEFPRGSFGMDQAC